MDEDRFITLFNNLHFWQNKCLLIEKYCEDNNKNPNDTMVFLALINNYMKMGQDLSPYFLDYAVRFYLEKFNLLVITYNNNQIIRKYNE